MRLGSAVRPAVFGAFDGVVTVLGVVFTLAGDPHATVLTGVGLAAAGTVSMGGGEWLSDSEHGFWSSLVIGLTTGAGTMVPVLPYCVASGAAAALWSAVLCLLVAAGISAARAVGRGWRKAAVETYGVLAVAAGATWLAAWATGTVG